jgi:menaquinone-dependent protoporphyrinogen IX oxidase
MEVCGRALRPAHRFLRRHQDELAVMPVAVFGLGPRRDDDEAWQQSRMQLDRALAAHRWLIPVAVGLSGAVDPPRRGHSERARSAGLGGNRCLGRQGTRPCGRTRDPTG